MSDRASPLTCIVQPELGALTETFIEAHHSHLSPRAVRIHGSPFPTHDDRGRPLATLGGRAVHALLARCTGRTTEELDRSIARVISRRSRERAMTRWLRRNRVEVVLAEYGLTGVAVRSGCRAARIPLVVHFHGYDAYVDWILDEHGDDYRRLFDDASDIVAVSRHMRSQLISLGAPAEKVHLNHYGVEVDAAPRALPANACTRFLSVGRFVDKKAPHLTLLAFERAVRGVDDARLVMIGDGPLLEACRDLAQGLGIGDRVDFAGALEPSAVAQSMDRAGCFVQHSVRASTGDMEGTPLAVLEAMAAGLPVVATRHAGIADVVEDGVTGYLVEERDVDGMASAMVDVASSPARAAELGAAGHRHILDHHSIEQRMETLRGILAKAAGRAGSCVAGTR